MKPELLAAMRADKATKAAVDRFVERRKRERELRQQRSPGVPDPGALVVGLLDLAEQMKGWDRSGLVALEDSHRHGDTMASLAMVDLLGRVRNLIELDRTVLEKAVTFARVHRRLRQSGPKPDRLLLLLIADLAGVAHRHAGGLRGLQAFVFAVNQRLEPGFRARKATLAHAVKTLRTSRR